MSTLFSADSVNLLLMLAIVIVVGAVLLFGGKRLTETLLALNSEILTLLVLLCLAILAGIVLGAGCKEILSNLISGLLGYLTKTGITAYKAATSMVPPAPATPPEFGGLQEPEEEAKRKETA